MMLLTALCVALQTAASTLPPPLPVRPVDGPGSPRDVPPLPGTVPVDPATLPGPIRDELEAPDPLAIDTTADELKDGLNRCPKCGATDIRQRAHMRTGNSGDPIAIDRTGHSGDPFGQ